MAAVPAFHDRRRGKLHFGRPHRKAPGQFAAAPADVQHRLINEIGERRIAKEPRRASEWIPHGPSLARGASIHFGRRLNIVAGNHFSNAEIALVLARSGHQAQGQVLCPAGHRHHRARVPAKRLALPCLAAIASSQDRAKLADRPAVLVVGKGYRPQRHGDSRGRRRPGAACIGRKEDASAGRARYPTLAAADGQRREVE